MKAWMAAVLLGAGVLGAARPVAGDGIGAGREVRYPTRFEGRVTYTPDGKRHVVMVPGDFKTRSTGVSLKNTRVGVVREVGKSDEHKTVYQLGFDDGRTLEVTTGAKLELDGNSYLALGPSGKDYYLLDLKTRKRLRFVAPPPDSSPASNSTTDGAARPRGSPNRGVGP